MRDRRIVISLLALSYCAFACDTPCGYRILSRVDSGTGQVGCCSASAMQDLVIPDERDLTIAIAHVAIAGRAGGQDVYLTTTDCARLFDAPYPEPGTGPRPVSRCQVLLGPVAPGTISPRANVAPGRYRAFVQAYAANASQSEYRFEVNVWGTSCGRSPAAP